MRRLDVSQNSTEPQHRSGLLSVWSAFALLAVGVLAIVAIDRGLASARWSSAQVCADSAALAGCRALLTDDLLRDDQPSDIPEWRAESCRQQAMAIAEEYRTSPTSSDRLTPTLRRQNIRVLKRVWSEESGRYISLKETLSPDAVQVFLTNRPETNQEQPATPSIGRITIRCKATAWLHDRICGFKTGPGVPILMAPLAIPNEPDQSLAGTWSATDDPEGVDQYGWDETERVLRKQSDGLNELALVISRTKSTVSPGRLSPVLVCRCDHSTPVAWRMRHGLNHADAAADNLGLLSFPYQASASDLSETDFDALAEVLFELVGHKRLFPLAEIADENIADADQDSEVRLTEVVAARILDVRLTGDQLHVLLQPTVMSPASAVVCRDNTVPRNRYVRKVALLR